ncbi:apolipoprotein C-I isoform X1 [Phoca vitulina]|nr:apolipoprotein C-I isoform X1 [Phoca vitulina]
MECLPGGPEASRVGEQRAKRGLVEWMEAHTLGSLQLSFCSSDRLKGPLPQREIGGLWNKDPRVQPWRVPLRPPAMRLFLSLPVLVVVLAMVLEGPAPTQAAPEISSTLGRIPDKLKEFGNTLEDKARAAIESMKQSDIPAKTRNWFSETFNKVKEQLKTAFS